MCFSHLVFLIYSDFYTNICLIKLINHKIICTSACYILQKSKQHNGLVTCFPHLCASLYTAEFVVVHTFQLCLHMFTLDFLIQVASGLEKDSMWVVISFSFSFSPFLSYLRQSNSFRESNNMISGLWKRMSKYSIWVVTAPNNDILEWLDQC